MPAREPTPYEKCRSKIIDKIMKEYEAGKLKSSRSGLVGSRKQAVAISLSIADKACQKKYGVKDIERMIGRLEKVMKSDRPFVRSNLQEFQIIYDWYKGKGSTLRSLILAVQWKLLKSRSKMEKKVCSGFMDKLAVYFDK